MKLKVLVADSCPTLCDPRGLFSPPGSSVHGDSPGKNTEVGCHCILQGILLIQGSNRGMSHSRQVLYSLIHQGSPLTANNSKPVLNVHWRTDAEAETPILMATWWEELTHWKRPWCWERLKAGREGDDRGWDGWMASPTQWTWVWASSGSWWWTGRPGVLQSMGWQRFRHEWETELNWMLKQ